MYEKMRYCNTFSLSHELLMRFFTLLIEYNLFIKSKIYHFKKHEKNMFKMWL